MRLFLLSSSSVILSVCLLWIRPPNSSPACRSRPGLLVFQSFEWIWKWSVVWHRPFTAAGHRKQRSELLRWHPHSALCPLYLLVISCEPYILPDSSRPYAPSPSFPPQRSRPDVFLISKQQLSLFIRASLCCLIAAVSAFSALWVGVIIFGASFCSLISVSDPVSDFAFRCLLGKL